MQTSEHSHFSNSIAYCGITSIPALFDDISTNKSTTPVYRMLFLSAVENDIDSLLLQLRAKLNTFLPPAGTEFLQTSIHEMTSDALVVGQRFIVGNVCLDVYPHLVISQLKQLRFSTEKVAHWHFSELDTNELPATLVWQMGLISCNDAKVTITGSATTPFKQALVTAGFQIEVSEQINAELPPVQDEQHDQIVRREKSALLKQQQRNDMPFPIYDNEKVAQEETIAIVGAGVAGSQLALSLAEKGYHTQVFCQDDAPGESASGNRQGALYPLLAPESGAQNRFFVQAYEFSRQRIKALSDYDANLAHRFCGVLQTGFDERSRTRLQKITNGQPWSEELLHWVDARQASAIAEIELKEDAIYYPAGAWVCPKQLTQTSLRRAIDLGLSSVLTNCQVEKITQDNAGWWLLTNTGTFGPYQQLVLANGAGVTQVSQCKQLAISPFRGQVSEIDTNATLTPLKTVLCAKGYLTPQWQHQHCLGATYIKGDRNCEYRQTEQQDNLDKLKLSYPDHGWVESIEVGSRARVGVRMVTRDHLPMVGMAPDIEAIMNKAQVLGPTPESIKYWQSQPAPTLQGLYLLAGLGSRGICSGPLAAEILASQLTHQPMPVSNDVLQALNPNRMWMRKLLKGRAIT